MRRITYDYAGPEHPVHPGHDDSDAMVFLTAPKRFKMRKRVRDTGDKMVEVPFPGMSSSTRYPKGVSYTFEVRRFVDADGMFDILHDTHDWENTFLIRGGVLASMEEKCARKHTRGEGQSLVEVPRRWAMIDVDATQIVLPPDWREDEANWAHAVIAEILPEAFHEAGCVVVYSSKAHPLGGQPKMHFFFLFDRPLLSEEVALWAGGLADTSVLDPGHVHLLARPEFLDEDGNTVDDPLEDLTPLMIEGPVVKAPDQKWFDRLKALRRAADRSDSRDGEAVGSYGWTRFLENFADDDDENHGLNRVLLALTMSYCSLTPPKNRDMEMLRTLARQAATAAVADGKLRREPEEIDLELGDKFTDMYERAKEKAASRWARVPIKAASEEDVADLGYVAPSGPGRFKLPNPTDLTPEQTARLEALKRRVQGEP